MKTTLTETMIKLLGLVIALFPITLSNWCGIVALFSNHPTFWQTYSAMAIAGLVAMIEDGKGPTSKILQVLFAFFLFCWVIRLVGIMPNAPF